MEEQASSQTPPAPSPRGAAPAPRLSGPQALPREGAHGGPRLQDPPPFRPLRLRRPALVFSSEKRLPPSRLAWFLRGAPGPQDRDFGGCPPRPRVHSASPRVPAGRPAPRGAPSGEAGRREGRGARFPAYLPVKMTPTGTGAAEDNPGVRSPVGAESTNQKSCLSQRFSWFLGAAPPRTQRVPPGPKTRALRLLGVPFFFCPECAGAWRGGRVGAQRSGGPGRSWVLSAEGLEDKGGEEEEEEEEEWVS